MDHRRLRHERAAAVAARTVVVRGCDAAVCRGGRGFADLVEAARLAVTRIPESACKSLEIRLLTLEYTATHDL